MRGILGPLALVAVLGCMIVPPPYWIIDLLLIGNLGLALLLLISTLYVSEPLKLSALPSILLIATITRLALNVASSRMILSSGHAGAAIETFGHVVIQNNLVVGAVIFLIISFIQFMVIAKGAERVAEVSARFVLDALPGKQMAIDADVRNGLLDLESARRKRAELGVESRFYGALDGAMKFVKGDAVAGLVIVGINLLGGISSGLLLEGLDPSAAVTKYSILAFGDGLITQIPALLSSLAAGMVVTRVDGADGNLATVVVDQLGQVKPATVLMSIALASLAFLPGMPVGTCISLSVACLAWSSMKPREPAIAAPFVPSLPPLLQVELSEDLTKELVRSSTLLQLPDSIRSGVYVSSGVFLPWPVITTSTALEKQARILIRQVAVADLEIGSPGQAVELLLRELSPHVPAMIDDTLMRRLLDFVERDAPELVAAAVPGMVSLTTVTSLCRNLLMEGLSIRSLDVILQAIAEAGSKDERQLLESVRISLGRLICAPHLTGHRLTALGLDPLLDLVLARAECDGRAYDPAILDGVVTAAESWSHPFVVSRSGRRLLKDYLGLRGFDHSVIAYEEVPRDVRVDLAFIVRPGCSAERVVDELAA